MASKKTIPFKLRDFRGLNPDHVKRLQEHGIKNAEQMLKSGCTRKQRIDLARATGISEKYILELVKLSDLARLPGVKGIRARLYYDAGVDCIRNMASWEPNDLLEMVAKYVEKTGFDGIPPQPGEVQSTIANARNLPIVLKE
jgi:hypothetical protein